MDPKQHWGQVYATKSPLAVSWYELQATVSLELIAHAGIGPEAPLIDVGGGASTLVDGLLSRGYRSVTVLDLAGAALAASRARLGDAASLVTWVEGDVRSVELPGSAYELWHDRAVFHFLTEPADRRAYVRQLLHALRPRGHVIIATFALEGPPRCSGLPVVRYDAAALAAELRPEFRLLEHRPHDHVTPAGVLQKFIYCRFLRLPG